MLKRGDDPQQRCRVDIGAYPHRPAVRQHDIYVARHGGRDRWRAAFSWPRPWRLAGRRGHDRSRDHHRHELWDGHAGRRHVLSPPVQQALSNAMPPRDIRHVRTGLAHLDNNAGLGLGTPNAPRRKHRDISKILMSRRRHVPVSSNDQRRQNEPLRATRTGRQSPDAYAEFDAIIEYEEKKECQLPRLTTRDKRRLWKQARDHKTFLRTLFEPPPNKISGGSFFGTLFAYPVGKTSDGKWFVSRIKEERRKNVVKPPRRSRLATRYITRDEIIRVHEAQRFANYLGFVLNVELTIDWEQAGYKTPDSINGAYEDFIERFRKFAEYRKMEPMYITAFENAENLVYRLRNY